jgi:hypothetical protein
MSKVDATKAEGQGLQQLALEKASWNRLTAAVRLIFNEGA